LKNLFHGVSWFCLRVFKATHTEKILATFTGTASSPPIWL
jgi:hypothetical protein